MTAAADEVVRVRADEWRATAERLRAEGFDFLQNLTAVDWIKDERIELVYHLWSYARRAGCVVKIDVPRAQPEAPSVASVWRAADWYEREQFDLLGVVFAGHPDLRRILMPDDWPGHPMRKDYVEATSYRGMPTTRANTLELLPIWDKSRGETKPDGAK
ncbi:MAG TPA: NADH-quinone oxidoreductase subunit C [Polyangia bacterium]|nr:NADH-quinone oxidoreductase subunit C [Polyangia bacterium]